MKREIEQVSITLLRYMQQIRYYMLTRFCRLTAYTITFLHFSSLHIFIFVMCGNEAKRLHKVASHQQIHTQIKM